MVNESVSVGIAIAVIGGLLLIIFGNPIKDILTPPKAIPIAKYYNDKVCPSSLKFLPYGERNADFSVEFQNVGDDGTIFVTLYSKEIKSRTSDEEEFESNSTKAWFVNSREYEEFDFDVKQLDEEDNFTISFIYGCYEKVLGINFYCREYTRCCNYQKEVQGSDYSLVNQKC